SDLSGKFRYDHPVIGIPLADNRSLIDLFPVLDEQLGTVGNVVGAQSDPGLGIDDLDLGGPGYHNIGLSTAIVHSCHGTKVLDLHSPTKLGYELAVLGNVARNPPTWKVRRVNWVPGSPMDCAATTPTASPL